MPAYRERLHVPVTWWLLAAGCVLILGAELFAGFSITIGVIVYVVLALACAAMLLHWGGAMVAVSGGELRAASVRLPLSVVGDVRPLDEAQTRAMSGPRADPAAYLLIRPYLRQSVYVSLSGPGVRLRRRLTVSRTRRRIVFFTEAEPGTWPYLLIGTRAPAELAGAIERSRAAVAAAE